MFAFLFLLPHAPKFKIDYPLALCPTPRVDQVALERAIDFWEDRGIDFSIAGPSYLGECSLITVNPDILTSEGKVAEGLTHWSWSGKVITHSTVELREADNWIVLAHELGHVAGYHHVNPIYRLSIMHKYEPPYTEYLCVGLPHCNKHDRKSE